VYDENDEKVPLGTLALLALSITDCTSSAQTGINDTYVFGGEKCANCATVPSGIIYKNTI